MMKLVRIYLLSHVVMTVSVLVHTFNPHEDVFKESSKKVCNLYESCDSTWISFKAEGEDDVRHLSVKTVALVELCNLKGQKSVVVHF